MRHADRLQVGLHVLPAVKLLLRLLLGRAAHLHMQNNDVRCTLWLIIVASYYYAIISLLLADSKMILYFHVQGTRQGLATGMTPGRGGGRGGGGGGGGRRKHLAQMQACLDAERQPSNVGMQMTKLHPGNTDVNKYSVLRINDYTNVLSICLLWG